MDGDTETFTYTLEQPDGDQSTANLTINYDFDGPGDSGTDASEPSWRTRRGTNAGDGDDHVIGTAANDTLHGGAGSDTLEGGDGDDTLYGDEGNDALFGGAGDDILDGGDGADIMTGGAGADTFIVGADDTVEDYVSGEDTIDISAILSAIGASPTSRREAVPRPQQRSGSRARQAGTDVEATFNVAGGAATRSMTSRRIPPEDKSDPDRPVHRSVGAGAGRPGGGREIAITETTPGAAG